MLEPGEVPLLDRLLEELVDEVGDGENGTMILCRGLRSGRGRCLGFREVAPGLAAWWEASEDSGDLGAEVADRAAASGARARALGPDGQAPLGWVVTRGELPERVAGLVSRTVELGAWIAGERRHLASMVEVRTAEIERTRHELQGVDPETGLANRRDFDRTFDREWRRAARLRRPLGLMLVEIGAGITRPLAGRVASVPGRATDLVARFDDRRLAILLPDTEPKAAERIAGRLVEALGETPIRVGIGGVTPRVGFLEPRELLQIARRALDAALRGEAGTVELREIDDVAAMTGDDAE